MFEFFISTFISLLVIANPFGVSAVFVGLMAQAEAQEIKKTANKAILVAGGLLFLFALFGEALLAKLGITLSAFRVAGGLLLFVIAFRMLFGEVRPGAVPQDPRAFVDKDDIAVFPLGIPLIAGPGCMTLTILLAGHAKDKIEYAIVFVAIVAVLAVTYACLLASRTLQRIIGASGTNIIARVMGMILAAKSVQFIFDGLYGMHLISNSG